MIKYDDFDKLDITIGEILSVERVPDTDKLLKLSVDFGEECPRQIISGINEYFNDIQTLIGVKCAFVTNIEQRVIRGLESNGMILAIGEGNTFSLLVPQKDVSKGATIR